MLKRTVLTIVLAICLVGSLAWGYKNYTEAGELKQVEAQLRSINLEQSQKIAKQEAQLKNYIDAVDRAFDKWEGRINYLEEGLQYAGEKNGDLERQVRILQEENERLGSLLQEYKAANRRYEETLTQIKREAEQAQNDEMFGALLNLIFSLF